MSKWSRLLPFYNPILLLADSSENEQKIPRSKWMPIIFVHRNVNGKPHFELPKWKCMNTFWIVRDIGPSVDSVISFCCARTHQNQTALDFVVTLGLRGYRCWYLHYVTLLSVDSVGHRKIGQRRKQIVFAVEKNAKCQQEQTQRKTDGEFASEIISVQLGRISIQLFS